MQPQAPGSTVPLTSTAEFSARRVHAYNLGEAKARRREIGTDAYLFLYKELVGLAGERTYCWPGLDYLATVLDTSVGTIKRWMRELEQANLIQRKPRPGGLTSLTYITAYLNLNALVEGPVDDVGDTAAADSSSSPPATDDHALAAESTNETFEKNDQQPPCARAGQPALFFVAEPEIISDRPAGSFPIPQSVKTHEVKDGGGRQTPPNSPDAIAPEIAALLQSEGILSRDALNELQVKPLAEMEAISRYLDHQKNVQSRPGLFVWLARHDFGTMLLDHPKRHATHPSSARRRGGAPGARGCSPIATAALRPAPAGEQLWQDVLDRLRETIPSADYATWIEPTILVALEDGTAVVAAPNVFVRDELERVYRPQLEAALSQALVRSVMVQTVVG